MYLNAIETLFCHREFGLIGFISFDFPAYFRLSPLQKHVRKVVGGFGKKSSVSTGVRKPGNTYASPTAMI